MKKHVLSISLAIALAALTASCVPVVTVPNPSPAVASVPVTFPAETSTASSPQIVLQTISFAPDFTSPLRNPERGFFEGFGLEETSLDWYVELGYTLAYTEAGDLRAYIHRDLPTEYLQRLNAHFRLARQAGIKLIVRFFYNDGETYPAPAPDASLEQVLRHIQQLAPTLEANKDVIAWFEAGFIGAWGEWHTSASGLDSPANKAAIRDALFAAFPQDRFILFRYPGDFTAWYPQPLSEEQAFRGSPQARLGHHNDCFLASDDDWGTYYDVDGSLKIEAWKNYLSQMTRFVPMSGETCNPNPPRSDCKTALQEMELLHWSAINQAYHPAVIQGWKEQGCFDEISNRLGYRLALLQAEFPVQAQAGGSFSFRVELENSGFAAPMLPRPVYLILAAQDKSWGYPIEADPRRWEPGRHTLSSAITLPADLPAGVYRLALWLPDSSTSLQADPRYAIRFANPDLWDAEHGWNLLGTVEVLSAQGEP